jgi:hypothetical protein
MLGLGAGTGVVLSAFSYTGGLGDKQIGEDKDGVEDKLAAIERYRNPISETIDEIGEGRGRITSLSEDMLS